MPNATHHGILITNEGAYANNNAELAFLDTENKTIYNQLFFTANQKSLGDVVQSIALINGYYYVVVNNSNKIVIIDPTTFKEIRTISSIQSPRSILQVSATKAYVSCLYHPRIYVIDLVSNTLIRTIAIDHPNTEQMLLKDGFCYVTNWDTASNKVYKVNCVTDEIDEKIQIEGRASHGIVLDKDGNCWILSGNKYKSKASHLCVYHPVTHQMIRTLAFLPVEDPFRLTINHTRDTLYFIQVNYDGGTTHNGLYKMSIHDTVLPTKPFIQANLHSFFWAMGIDSTNQHIFLSDPKGFTQQSTIYEYTANGTLLHEYQTGVGANGFLFK